MQVESAGSALNTAKRARKAKPEDGSVGLGKLWQLEELQVVVTHASETLEFSFGNLLQEAGELHRVLHLVTCHRHELQQTGLRREATRTPTGGSPSRGRGLPMERRACAAARVRRRRREKNRDGRFVRGLQ